MEEAERSATISNVRRVVRMGRRDQLLLMERGERGTEEESKLKLLKQTADVDDELIRAKYDDEDDDGNEGGWSDTDDKARINSDESDLDASDDDDDDDDSNLDASDDEDEEAAL